MLRKSWVAVLGALAVAIFTALTGMNTDAEPVRIGIVTDVHAHDTNSPVEDKVMTNSAERLTAFVHAMNGWPADAVIELGDLVNGAFVMGAPPGDPTRISQILAETVALLSRLDCPLHYVLGNHDMYDLSKAEFLAGIDREDKYYSFDLGAFHFVVLDAEYDPPGEDYDHVFMRVKGMIPPAELEWLRGDLSRTDSPTIVCIHQPLDSEFDPLAGGPPVANNHEVQQVLGESGVVIAVFQGHDHENRYAQIDGIHYVTFAAMVDHTEHVPPTWAQVTLDATARTITIEGFGLQSNWELAY